jgi:hypothetical protein
MNEEPITIIRVSGKDTLADYTYIKDCIYCKNQIAFTMTTEQYNSWKIHKNYIQNVFPHLDSSTREAMISGTHPQCWDQIFQDENEELFVEDYTEIISNWRH